MISDSLCNSNYYKVNILSVFFISRFNMCFLKQNANKHRAMHALRPINNTTPIKNRVIYIYCNA